MLELGNWLRRKANVPFLCVNTLHLPTAYNVLLPDPLVESRVVQNVFADRVMPWVERQCAGAYNRSDGLIVLSRRPRRLLARARRRGAHLGHPALRGAAAVRRPKLARPVPESGRARAPPAGRVPPHAGEEPGPPALDLCQVHRAGGARRDA